MAPPSNARRSMDADTPCSRPAGRLPPELAALLVDGHCHPTDTLQGDAVGAEALAAQLRATEIGTICTMSTRFEDFALVRRLVRSQPQDQGQTQQGTQIVPAFGIHPWYAHHVSLSPGLDKEAHYRALFPSPATVGREGDRELDELDVLLPYLPDPVPLEHVLAALRAALDDHPTALVGEVGLDRAFRLPRPAEVRSRLARLSPDTKPKGTLSSLVTPLAHQRAILDAQLALASAARRSVSMHAVRATGEVTALLKQISRARPNIVLHSCTLNPNALLEALGKPKAGVDFGRGGQVYASFSAGINLKSTPGQRDASQAEQKLKEQVLAVPPDRLLTETDHVDPRELHPALLRLLHILEQVEQERSPAEDQRVATKRAARPRTLDEVFFAHALPAFTRGSYVPPRDAPAPSETDDRRVRILHALRYNWDRFCRPRPARWDEEESGDED